MKGCNITYCPGPVFTTIAPITTNTIVMMIDILTKRFGPGYSFEPEPITEGGIKMTNWPGKTETQFKTFRIQIVQGTGNWPIIYPNQLDTWKHGDEVTIWSGDKIKGHTCLKAFFGAPCWTTKELDHFLFAMAAVGWKYTKKSVPKKTKLSKYDDDYLGVKLE